MYVLKSLSLERILSLEREDHRQPIKFIRLNISHVTMDMLIIHN